MLLTVVQSVWNYYYVSKVLKYITFLLSKCFEMGIFLNINSGWWPLPVSLSDWEWDRQQWDSKSVNKWTPPGLKNEDHADQSQQCHARGNWTFFFKMYVALYMKHCLEDKPHLIFNCDETGFGDTRQFREEVLCQPESTSRCTAMWMQPGKAFHLSLPQPHHPVLLLLSLTHIALHLLTQTHQPIPPPLQRLAPPVRGWV